ncbi:uncharacterized protein LOC132726551 [Ruditapes philippinarum]|uniref:uncharacterized protein LOC132726551 n=1 Tax=Ruditapes philippinarum TaxID=129788 RepID=UPI00295B67F7|nr:uncharacterized protein LOC132726551 [Ruditapes philippinarum]
MATHFICQSTEPLAHNYPSGLAGRTHGAVSQYEVYNNSTKPHTRFPPPGWDFSHSSEEDSLPLLHTAPQPESKNSSFMYDPDLCITPQKAKSSSSTTFSSFDDVIFKKPDANPDPDLTLTPMKALDEISKVRSEINNDKGKKPRVRFDLDETDPNVNEYIPKKSSPDKQYKPELYDEDDDDYEFDIGPEGTKVLSERSENARNVKCTVENYNSQSVFDPLKETCTNQGQMFKSSNVIKAKSQVDKSDKKGNKTIPKTQTVGQKVVKVVREKSDAPRQASIPQLPVVEKGDPIAACRVPEKTGPKRKVKVLRDNQYTHVEAECNYPFRENPVDDYAGGEEHMFARPEYNSTLRMKLEAEKLKESSVDLDTALQRKLKVSQSTKADINEKAASLVNTEGTAFSGLVSLNVPAEEVCKQAVEMKSARAKQIKMPKSKFKDHREPDLMEFFSSERQKESVTLSLPGISAPSEHLSTASHSRAFDLYKHNRVWEKSGRL